MVQSGESGAWERAQEAIDRAEQRDGAVVTPDNARSPFDATETTILAIPGRGRPAMPAPHPRSPSPGGTAGAPVPARRSPPRAAVDDEPPTTPVEVSDPDLVPVGGPVAAVGEDDPATEDLRTTRPGADGAGRVAPSTRPPTAPFEAAADEADDAPPPARRPWWRRLLPGRR